MPVQLETQFANGTVTWEVIAGILPPGLELDSETGIIDGVPTLAGVFAFTVEATDTADPVRGGGTQTDQQDLSITVDPISIVLDVDPDTIGPFTQYVGPITPVQFTATGDPGPFVFTIADGDALPNGLTLSPSGLLTGTPLVSGVFNFGVEARTTSPGGYGITNIALTVIDTPAINITSGAPTSPVRINEAYSFFFTAADGVPPPTWTVSSGSLPPGLGLNPSTGELSGTPTANGTYNFTVRATDSLPSIEFDEVAVSVQVYTAVTVDAQTPPLGVNGSAYNYQFTSSDGLPGTTFTWSLQAGALPTGLTLNPDGTVTGTPTVDETQAFTVRVTDDTTGDFDDFATSIQVYTQVSIPAQTPTAGIVGSAYSYTFTESDGLGPFTWSIVAGALPTGLSLNPATGEISGTPTTEETQAFTIQVLDTLTSDTDTLASSINVITGNSFADTLLALGADHYWALDEAQGVATLADSGNTAGFDLSLTAFGGSTDFHWARAPSLAARGNPATYGMWKANSDRPRPASTSGPAIVGHDTGNIGVTFRVFGAFGGLGDNTIFAAIYDNSTGTVWEIKLDSSERIEFRMNGTSGRSLTLTAPTPIVRGELYQVHVEQPADGGGAELWINGVDSGATPVLTGIGIDNDSWVSEIMQSQTAITDINLGGRRIFDANYAAVISSPYITVNGVFGGAGIASLYSSLQLGLAAQDIHEFIYDLSYPNNPAGTLRVWHLGSYIGNNNQGLYAHPNDIEPRGTGFDAGSPSEENALDNAGVGSQVESLYDNMRKQVYGAGPGQNPTFFTIANNTPWDPVATNGIPPGTVCACVTVNGVPNGDRKIIFTFGTGSTNSLEIGVVGSVLGWQIFFRAFESSVETYRQLSGIIALGGSEFGTITIAQPGDGSGPRMYWQDQDVTSAPAINTNPDVWMDTFGESSDSRWGGEQGSQTVDNWEPGELHFMLGWKKQLTGQQVDELWDAVLGSVVAPTPTAVVLAGDAPDANNGDPYSYTYTTTFGSGNFSYSIIAGALPTGLSLNTSTGEISGTPTVDETANFTVQVLDTSSLDTDTVVDSIEITSVTAGAWQTNVSALGPTLWYRFCELDGNDVLNRGSQGSGADLAPTTFGNAFNATYRQNGVNPDEGGNAAASAGVGAMKFNQGGQLRSGADWNGSYGTVFFTLVDMGSANFVNGEYVWSVTRSFDIDGVLCFLAGSDTDCRLILNTQNASTGDSSVRVAAGFGIDLTANPGTHTFCIRKNNDTNFPDLFVDGVEITGAARQEIVGTAPIDYWFDDFNPDQSGIGARGGVSSGTKLNEVMDEFLYFEDEALTDAEILQLHTDALGSVDGNTAVTLSMSDNNVAQDDGDFIFDGRLVVTGSFLEGADQIEFICTDFSTSQSGSTAPTFPGGTWDVISNFGSFMGWDDGTEQPPDGPYVFDGGEGPRLTDGTDPFQDDGGGNWIRITAQATNLISGEADSNVLEFFFRESGI